jgi:hypothetical protein
MESLKQLVAIYKEIDVRMHAIYANVQSGQSAVCRAHFERVRGHGPLAHLFH